MFIRDGKIVLSASMDEVGERYTEVMVPGDKVDAANALQPIDQRTVFGKSVMLFDGVPRTQLAALGETRNPERRRPVRRDHERKPTHEHHEMAGPTRVLGEQGLVPLGADSRGAGDDSAWHERLAPAHMGIHFSGSDATGAGTASHNSAT